jgi:integrase
MPHKSNALTAAKVRTAKPGRYGDGGGLYLLVKESGNRTWIFRYTLPGQKMREMGLGRAGTTADAVPLAEAREKAAVLIKMVRDDIDPLARREDDAKAAAAAKQEAAIRAVTFSEAAKHYIANNEAGWTNQKHAKQWTSSLRTYVYPHFGDIPTADIETAHVMKALEPIWSAKPETASRVRGRIEAILDFAKSRGWRQGENPATWKGNISHNLPKRSKVAAVVHHPALPWVQVPAFMTVLRTQEGMSAKALEFAIYTAGRTNEVLESRWSEIDFDKALWTVPAARMKAKKAHTVPLSAPAIAVLRYMLAFKAKGEADGYIFPGARPARPLSPMSMNMMLRRMMVPAVPHGFRSSFRDFAAENTTHPNEVAEAALAHVVKNLVEAAYRRGDLLEKRKRLMDDWATFCSGDN